MCSEYEDHLKLLLLGDSGVGKSCLLLRLAGGDFTPGHMTTIGVDLKLRTLELEDGRRVRVQLWDTAGQERFRTITSTYYRGTHGVLLVYDVTNSESFFSVKRWIHEVQENCDQRIVLVLVGNKDDEPSRKVVLSEDAERFATLMGLRLFETSAKENRKVEESFQYLAREALRQKGRTPEKEVVRLTKKKKKKKKKTC